MREFKIYDESISEWVKIDIKELKKGDEFIIYDDGKRYYNTEFGIAGVGKWRVVSDEYVYSKEGYELIYVEDVCE